MLARGKMTKALLHVFELVAKKSYKKKPFYVQTKFASTWKVVLERMCEKLKVSDMRELRYLKPTHEPSSKFFLIHSADCIPSLGSRGLFSPRTCFADSHNPHPPKQLRCRLKGKAK